MIHVLIMISAAIVGLAALALFIVAARIDNTYIAKGCALVIGACMLAIIAAASMAPA